nr:reverse transcriptase domain-containing protein [Tanacetum cinerariifolium]
MEEPSHLEFNTGAEDQPIVQSSQHPESFSQQQKPPTLDRDWNKTLPATYGSIQPWISKLAKQSESRSSFNELMDTPLDFSNFLINRLKVDTLTPKLIAGPTYELLKGSCKSLVELEYHLEEVYKATTDQLDWVNPEGQQYPHILLKPLPLIPNNQGHRVIPFDHFINNDLEYLRGEDLVPRTMWIEEPICYDKHALWGVSHWGRKRQQFYGFAVNRESAHDVYSKRRIIRRVEDLQLGVESYQKKLNLTKPDTYRSYLKRKESYIAYSNLRGFIYQNKDKKNRLMRIDELHKFSDGTLIDIRIALNDHLKGIRMQYLSQSIWRKSDKDRAAAMIQAIDKRLKTRRIMRSLERKRKDGGEGTWFQLSHRFITTCSYPTIKYKDFIFQDFCYSDTGEIVRYKKSIGHSIEISLSSQEANWAIGRPKAMMDSILAHLAYDSPVNANAKTTVIHDDSEDEVDEFEKEVEPSSSKQTKNDPPPLKAYKPKILYPQCLCKEKMEEGYAKFIDLIKEVRINISLVDALAGMPNYRKFVFPADFIILQMEKDDKVPFILGRPILYTADAIIRVKNKELNDDICFSVDVIEEVTKEELDALLDDSKPFSIMSKKDDDIDDNFPDETLMNVSSTKEDKIPWFADLDNYLVGKILRKEAKALPTNDVQAMINFLKKLFSRFGIPKSLISKKGEKQFFQLQELDKLRLQAYESSKLYKARTKAYHNRKLRIRKEFKARDKVLLYNSKYKFKAPKLKSKYYGPFMVKHGFLSSYVELYDKHGGSFIINGHRVKLYHDEGKLMS